MIKSMILLKHIILIVSLFCNPVFSNSQSSYLWEFPKDHGAHRAFNTEWWYFTGHLKSASNKMFGFELTFFRVNPSFNQKTTNDWSLNEIYFAHFAVTDDTKKTFAYFERVNRDSLQMAGAKAHGLHTWNGDWKAILENNQLVLSAKSSSAALRLTLDMNAPIIFQGDNGFSLKNHEGTQFSYYYSMPRINGNGSLTINGNTHDIDIAQVWFDHEFFNSKISDSSLDPQQQSIGQGHIGWDWFAMQFDDGTHVMIYKVRPKNPTHKPYYFGTWSDKNGKKITLNESMFTITELDQWKSSDTKSIYPSKWNIKIPSLSMDLIITPTLSDQELKLSHLNQIHYWEGRSLIKGTHTGNAYVELVGY